MASYIRTKIEFLADVWKFWFCCFSTKVAHFEHFFRNFNLNSFHILPPCHHVSWSIGTKAKISVIDTKGYQKSGIRTQLYLYIWAVGVAQNACTRFFGTEEVYSFGILPNFHKNLMRIEDFLLIETFGACFKLPSFDFGRFSQFCFDPTLTKSSITQKVLVLRTFLIYQIKALY